MNYYTHHDNPPKWVKQLREGVDEGNFVFCGCYEGDLSSQWNVTIPKQDKADYSIRYKAGHVLHFMMGPGQECLIQFITDLIAEAKEE